MYRMRNLLKRTLLGPENYPQTMTLGLAAPQLEVDVWLHGLDHPVHVTQSHMMASAAPLTICIGFTPDQAAGADFRKRLTLCFYSHGETQRPLGEISLRFVSSFRVGTQLLCLFHVAGYKNRTLSPLHLWAHHLQYARTYEPEKNRDVPITLREARAMIVFFLCPRPVVLVTAVSGEQRNMFPMNLMGSVGGGYFAFALNRHRSAAPLVESARRVVLSTVSPEQAPVLAKLGANHHKHSILWSELPFPAIQSEGFTAPIPAIALDVRELQVEESRPLGSHTLFVAKTITEQRLAEGPRYFMAHGLYQAWLPQNK